MRFPLFLIVAIATLNSCDRSVPQPNTGSPSDQGMIHDQTNPTDIFAVPLDNSEESQDEEMEKLQHMQKKEQKEKRQKESEKDSLG